MVSSQLSTPIAIGPGGRPHDLGNPVNLEADAP
jgi:hypothetical protein